MANSTRDGREWVPEFLIDIDAKTCIGCGRCFKVCGRGVMTLKGLTDEGELIDVDPAGDDDDEFERKIMSWPMRAPASAAAPATRSARRDCQTFSATPPALDLAA